MLINLNNKLKIYKFKSIIIHILPTNIPTHTDIPMPHKIELIFLPYAKIELTELFTMNIPYLHYKTTDTSIIQYKHNDTNKIIYCKRETLYDLFETMKSHPAYFISENLIPTGIFTKEYLDKLIENEHKQMTIEKLMTVPSLSNTKQLMLNNLPTIIALQYIQSRLLHHKMPFVEVRFT